MTTSSNSYTIDINETTSSSHNIQQGQSSSRIEAELSNNSHASSTSPTSPTSTSTSTSNKSSFRAHHWLALIVLVAITIALVLGLVLGLHYRDNNNNTVPIKQTNVCINQTTAFYQDQPKQVQAQATHSIHTLSHALPFHLLGLTQNGGSLNGIANNGIANNGIANNGIANNGKGLNGRDLNGIGLNGIGLNGLHNGIRLNGRDLNGIANNGRSMNGIALNGRTAMNGVQLNAFNMNGYRILNGFIWNGIGVNGIALNGRDLNGIGLNGRDLNGRDLNGRDLNGIGLNGRDLNGIGLNGRDLNGRDLNGRDLNGIGLNGENLNGIGLNGRSMNGRSMNGLDGFDTLQLQHGIPSNINGFPIHFDANITQEIMNNNKKFNITTLMDVPLTGLKPNWTGTLTFTDLSTELSQLSHMFMKYIIECALNDTQAVGFVWDTCDKDSTTHAEVFHGSMGLAPEWMNGPMSPENARFVSACLAARTNYYGVHVMISLRGPSPTSSFINTIDKDEQQTYNATEGAFWGDIWSENPELYACYHDKPQDQRTYSRSLQRDCASGHINPTTGAIEECGPIHIVGSCSQSCQGWNEENQYYTACRHNNTVPYSPQVITVALKSPQ